MKQEQITVYVTKYALTSGIKECVGEDLSEEGKYKFFRGTAYKDCYHNNDFHYTLEDAQIYAEQKRLKKIESLKKQIEKLENMKFNDQ